MYIYSPILTSDFWKYPRYVPDISPSPINFSGRCSRCGRHLEHCMQHYYSFKLIFTVDESTLYYTLPNGCFLLISNQLIQGKGARESPPLSPATNYYPFLLYGPDESIYLISHHIKHRKLFGYLISILNKTLFKFALKLHKLPPFLVYLSF